jgi:hypothetical protein
MDANPSCNATPVANAPTSDECALGIPPTFVNAEIFLLSIILIAWQTSHAIAMLSKMFIAVEKNVQNKNLYARRAAPNVVRLVRLAQLR